MKKVCFVLVLFILGISPLIAAECGDVNSDGTADIVDALLVAQYYVNLQVTDFDEEVADVNGDSNIDIVDALVIAQYYVGLIDQFTGCITSVTPSPTPGIPETVFAVNCGGSAYTASDGTEYAADRGYSGGTGYDNGSSVSGTSDPNLYSTERYGSCTYSIDVPNGDYLVTLYFAENYHTSSGSRIFNVIIEGTHVISNLDLYAEAGGNTAYVTEDRVTVSDGEINIEFDTVTENALINAIKVDAIELTGEPIVRFTVSPSNPKPNETVTVDASDSYDPNGAIMSYQVNWGDTTITNGAVTTHMYQNEDRYTITVTVTDNDGKSSSAAKTVTVATVTASAEDTGYDFQVGSPNGSNGGSSSVLPDPFTKWDGTQVKTMEDWRYRRRELVVEVEKRLLGEKAPPPARIGGSVTGSISTSSYSVNVSNPGGSTSFSGTVSLPGSGSAPYPAVIIIGGMNSLDSGVLSSEGVATMSYDNNSIASEASGNFTTGKYYDANPDYRGNTGALVAWAWGVSRIIDMLEKNPGVIDPTKIAIHGCSRLGKAAFVIGAFDQRIALGLPLEPGTGGPAPIRCVNTYGGQTLSSCNGEASWFGPQSSSYSSSAAVDMSDVVAMYAPRGLLMMDNPHIDHLSYKAGYVGCAAMNEVYKAMGKEDALWYLGNTNNGNHCSTRSEYSGPLRAMIRKFLKGDSSATTGGLDTHSNHGNINISGWTSTWKKGTISE